MTKKLAMALMIGLLAAASGPASAIEKLTIGNAQVVVRTVTGELDADLRKIKLLDDIYHNELIETGESSATELIFLDETKLALGPNSSLVLDRFVYDPEPDKASFVATASAGVFRFVSGNLPKKAYTIHTPTATIGIRGTVFTIAVIPADAKGNGAGPTVSVTVEQGIVEISDCNGEPLALDRANASATFTITAPVRCAEAPLPRVESAVFANTFE